MNSNAEGFKSLLTSKTVWGLIIAGVSRIVGTTVEVDDVTLQNITDTAAMLFEAGGAVLALYGRIVAKKQIKILPDKTSKEL